MIIPVILSEAKELNNKEMPEQISDNKRIAKNTLFLYVRQILIMIVGLYTVRKVLEVLGIEDYGIYNVVSGTVTMFSFLSGAMAMGSQRFFSYYIGKQDLDALKRVFHNTLTIYFILSLVIVLLGESIGVWFLNTKLVIPESRLFAANFIFQVSLLSFVISMISAPFMASIISHENMGVYARIGIIEVILKLCVVFALIYSPFDKLISYSILLFSTGVFVLVLYIVHCMKNYGECTIALKYDKDIVSEIASFSGWNLFGNFAWIIKNQGTSFLLNIFFGPVLNAAQNLATQVRTIVQTFAANFTNAVQPQIIKSYAKNDIDSMFKLMSSSSKLSFFLMAVIVIPVILNIDFILDLWLVNVPNYAVVFTQLMLIEATLEAMSSPVASVNQATGKIKYYQMIIGIIGIMNLPISYFALKMGANAEMVYIISLLLQICIVLHRAFYLRKIKEGVGMKVVSKVYFPCLFSGLLAFIICYYLYNNPSTIMTTLFTCAYEVLIVVSIGFLIALNRNERMFIKRFIFKKIAYEDI